MPRKQMIICPHCGNKTEYHVNGSITLRCPHCHRDFNSADAASRKVKEKIRK